MSQVILGSLLAVFTPLLMGAVGAAPTPPIMAPTIPDAARQIGVPSADPLPPSVQPGSSVGHDTEAQSEGWDRPPEIKLRNKSDSITPERHGAGMAESGKITVAARGGTLSATLTGAAYAHCYIGVHSDGLLHVRVVQEFEVALPDGPGSLVSLKLSGKLDGYLRREGAGTACLRSAQAAVYPAGCGDAVLWLAFPSLCDGPCGAGRYQQEFEVPARTLPVGYYVLVADLVPEASVEGLCRGHAESVFAPSPRAGTWASHRNPFAQVEDQHFGLVITVKAESTSAEGK
jgi:hypothetical protein